MLQWGGVIIDVGIIMLIGIAVPILSYLIGKALASPDYPSKTRRFESGNEQIGRARGIFLMQYYPYALLFMTVEPFVVFVFILLLVLGVSTTIAFVVGVGVMVPSMLYATKNAKVAARWVVEQTE